MKKAKKLLVLASVGVLSVTLYACNNNSTGTITRDNTNSNNNMQNITTLEASLNNLESAVNKYNNVNSSELTISSIAPSYGETNYVTSNGATQGSEYYSYLNKMNGVYNSNISVSTGSTRLNQSKTDVMSSIRNLRNALNNTNNNMDSSKKEVVDLYATTFNHIADNLNNLSKGYNNTLSSYKNLNLENLDLTNAKYSAILYEMELANSNLETSKKALDALLTYLNPTTNTNGQTSNLNNLNQNTTVNQNGVFGNNKMQGYNDNIVNNNLTNNSNLSGNQTQANRPTTLEERNTNNGSLIGSNLGSTNGTNSNSNQDTAVTLPAGPQPRADMARRNGRILRRADRTGRPISRMPRLSNETLQGDNMGQTTTSSQTTSTLSYKPTAVAR